MVEKQEEIYASKAIEVMRKLAETMTEATDIIDRTARTQSLTLIDNDKELFDGIMGVEYKQAFAGLVKTVTNYKSDNTSTDFYKVIRG